MPSQCPTCGNDAALRADAERYRWLREVGTPTLGRIAHANSGVLRHGYSTPEAVLDALARGDVDGAIDAAIVSRRKR